MGDPLFTIKNSFYLGAYNTVINEAADMDHLSSTELIERDCYVYRSYIALGSYDVSLHACKHRRIVIIAFHIYSICVYH